MGRGEASAAQSCTAASESQSHMLTDTNSADEWVWHGLHFDRPSVLCLYGNLYLTPHSSMDRCSKITAGFISCDPVAMIEYYERATKAARETSDEKKEKKASEGKVACSKW